MKSQSKIPSTGGSLAIHELLVPFLFSLALYAFTIPDNLAESVDGIVYIRNIDAGSDLFHPHHLLYNAIGYAWLAFWRFLGVTSDSAVVVALLNSVFGSLTLCVFYSLLRNRLRLNRITSLVGTALPAFSYGFWFYSVCVEVFMITLFFLMLTLYLLTADKLDAKQIALVGLTNGLAVLFHQVSVLFIPVVILAVLIRRNEALIAWRSVSNYAVTFLPTVVIPYLLVIFGVLRIRGLEDLWHWLTLYAHKSEYWHPLSLITFLRAVYGFSRSIIGSHFIFAIPSGRALAERVLGEGSFLEARLFLVRQMDTRLAIVLLGLSLVLALLFVLIFAFRFRNIRLLWRNQHALIPLTFTLLAILGIFFLFWMPSMVKFWIPQSLCLWLLVIGMMTARKDQGPRAERLTLLTLSTLAVLIFFVNSIGSIYVLNQRTNDYYYQSTAPIAEVTESNDLVIIERAWLMAHYFGRFTNANVLALSTACATAKDPQEYIQRVQNAIEETLRNRGRVFILNEAAKLDQRALQEFGEGIADITELWEIYEDKWEQAGTGEFAFFIIQPES